MEAVTPPLHRHAAAVDVVYILRGRCVDKDVKRRPREQAVRASPFVHVLQLPVVIFGCRVANEIEPTQLVQAQILAEITRVNEAATAVLDEVQACIGLCIMHDGGDCIVQAVVRFAGGTKQMGTEHTCRCEK